ncbi:YdcF family protein [Erwinia sp. HR93]|uniref:YdcF family protein n=1 Tax=Erwinia sp. HR93 TaxID=3094840 RepID=UPI002ADEE869|nr:YdcF family protein [Erwinia sp. HR93]MEA1064970.1 YdcF family protein [Erwinia sp. HR93]
MTIPFPPLAPRTLDAVNCLGRWLAQNDLGDNPQISTQGDVIILAGNAVIPTIEAACRLAAENARPLIISGGIGHSTPFLYRAVALHPRYSALPTTGRSEAEIIADIAHQRWQIPEQDIYIESHSTNCGENAAFTRTLCQQQGIFPRSAVIMQDPTMQRRTVATFARVWRGDNKTPRWLSYPGIVPELYNTERSVHFTHGDAGQWAVDRYLSLVLGEIPRLRDDASGYGPSGRDFIEHVEIPEAIEQAWITVRDDPQVMSRLQERSVK